MNILVTAGNTQVPIDRVRCLTNIFTGRTGARIALCGHDRGHHVILLTSHPEVVPRLRAHAPVERWTVRTYRTFDELGQKLEEACRFDRLDALVHCAAVSDFRAAGIYAPAPGTRFDPEQGRWLADDRQEPRLVDRAAAKVKSDAPELWLRLVRTPKLIDRVRGDWGFAGVLVKFKLEVGVAEEELLRIAEASRRQSVADLMVANTLESAASWAWLGPRAGQYERIRREDLPACLLEAVEQRHAAAARG
jgi:phosphopantothenoylcysteine synthetase/decarboxylase